MPVQKMELQVTFEFDYDYEAPVPGRYWGPPEDCYPESGESIEINEVRLLTQEETPVGRLDWQQFEMLVGREAALQIETDLCEGERQVDWI